MKESIGNAMLFYIIITFVIIMIIFFVGSLSYSKASKVKNKIIEEIEKEGEIPYNSTASDAYHAYDRAEPQIQAWLDGTDGNNHGIGYRKNVNNMKNITLCDDCNDGSCELVSRGADYQYCVYRFNTCNKNQTSNCGYYYKVTDYMFFDIPIIGELIQLPVSGETIIFHEINS